MSRVDRLTTGAVGPERVLLVPLGATEQHGPHLPLGTDTDVASAVCRLVAARTEAVVVAPALPYGASGEHADFAGTLSIGQDALESVVVELGRSATLTWSRVLFVSGHGGNAAPLTRAVRLLRAESRDVRAWSPSRGVVDAHAGRTETSVQLHLNPVDVRLAEARAGRTEPVAELLPQLAAHGVAHVSPTWVLGDPDGASAAEGEALLAGWVEDLAAYLERWIA